MMFLLSLDQLGQEVTLSSITGKVVQTQVYCFVKCHLHGLIYWLTYSPANGNVYQVVQPLECRSSLQEVGDWGWALRVTPSSLCFLGNVTNSYCMLLLLPLPQTAGMLDISKMGTLPLNCG